MQSVGQRSESMRNAGIQTSEHPTNSVAVMRRSCEEMKPVVKSLSNSVGALKRECGDEIQRMAKCLAYAKTEAAEAIQQQQAELGTTRQRYEQALREGQEARKQMQQSLERKELVREMEHAKLSL